MTKTSFDLTTPNSALVRAALAIVLCGRKCTNVDVGNVAPNDLNPRSYVRWARALIERGWARTAQIVRSGRKVEIIEVIPTAILAAASATEPNLVAKWTTGHASDPDLARHGLAWRALSLAEQVWVVQQASAPIYLIATDRWGREPSTVTVGSVPNAAFSEWGDQTLMVTTLALREHIDRTTLHASTRQVFNGNLPWALEHFAGVAEGEAKHWRIETEEMRKQGRFFGHAQAEGVLPEDVSKWAKSASGAIAKAQAEVQAAIARLTSLQTTVARVEATGGWTALAEKLLNTAAETAAACDAEKRLGGKSHN